MKKYLIIAICISFCLSSCIKESSTLTEFVVTNESSKDIKLKVSHFKTNYYGTVDTTFSIKANSKLEYSYGGGIGSQLAEPFGGSADSAIFIIDSIPYILYTRANPSDKNVLFKDSYIGEEVSGGRIEVYRYIYIIKDEDFEFKSK